MEQLIAPLVQLVYLGIVITIACLSSGKSVRR